MNDGTGRALHGLKGFANDMVAALGEHLHGHILGDHILLDQRAQKLVFGFARRRKSHLDLLKAHRKQHFVKFHFFLQAHRHDQALVAIAQVHTAPCGRGGDMVFLGPLIVPCRGRIISDLIFGCIHHNCFPS